ncbi:unnamed protein product [Rangifer tarandus platyrhynchus]|uniref:Uncharacterized protein n=1 Tax=Rangifer tarandus platyrhynchus TaxID=3082113 RepID=A0AC59YP99_RANTA
MLALPPGHLQIRFQALLAFVQRGKTRPSRRLTTFGRDRGCSTAVPRPPPPPPPTNQRAVRGPSPRPRRRIGGRVGGGGGRGGGGAARADGVIGGARSAGSD